jgi:hypothetical protein
MSRSMYDQDFLLWAQQQAEMLRKGHWQALDVEHLVEELEALGRSEQKELGSYLQVLLTHLLKYHYQPERRTKSWDQTIINRDKIADCLEDTPSLRRFLQDSDWMQKYYRRARRDASRETQMPADRFPLDCPYTVEQILDPEFG